jgi:hypothetical protein
MKSNPAKSLLYDAASAALALKSAGEIVPVEGGADVMAVGAKNELDKPSVLAEGFVSAMTMLVRLPATLVHLQCSLVQSPPMRLTGGELRIVPVESQYV